MSVIYVSCSLQGIQPTATYLFFQETTIFNVEILEPQIYTFKIVSLVCDWHVYESLESNSVMDTYIFVWQTFKEYARSRL